MDVIGTFDQSGLRENEFGIYAVGTFRIAGEEDESKQPMFNLASINCEKQPDDMGKVSLNVKLRRLLYGLNQVSRTQTIQIVRSISTFNISMKELQKGVLTGIETSAYCLLQHDTDNRSKYEKGISVVHENEIRRQLR